jgi:hypothetical protein
MQRLTWPPARALGDPIFDLITKKTYADQQSMLDDMEPKGLHQYWKTEYLPGLSREYLNTFRNSALKATSPLSYSVIFHVGGALNEHEDDDGVVGNRDARFISGFSGVWTHDAHPDEHMAWVRDAWEKIRPFSPPAGTMSISSWPRMTPPGPPTPTGETTSASNTSRPSTTRTTCFG